MWLPHLPCLSVLLLLWLPRLLIAQPPSPLPVITRVSGCWDSHNTNSTSFCPAQSSYLPLNLTIVGQHFPLPSSSSPSYPYPLLNTSITVGPYPCPSPIALSPLRLLCLLPNASYSLSPSNFLPLTVDFHAASTSALNATLVRAVNYEMRTSQASPLLFGASGCEQLRDPVGGALNCSGGEVVAFVGAFIPTWQRPVLVVGDAVQALNCSLDLDQPAVVDCRLPPVIATLTAGRRYQYTLCFGWNGTQTGLPCSPLQPGLTVKAGPISGTVPTISRISGCADLGGMTQLCPPQGSINLTLYGSNLAPQKPQGVTLGPSAALTCAPLLLVSNSELVCRLPAWSVTGLALDAVGDVSVVYSQELQVRVRRAISYSAQPSQLAIIDVTGCRSKRGSIIRGCSAGQNITIAGYAFPYYARDSAVVTITDRWFSFVSFPACMSDTAPATLLAVLPPEVSRLPTERVLWMSVHFAPNLTSRPIAVIAFGNTTLVTPD